MSSSEKSIFRSSSHLNNFYLCILFFGCVGSSLLCGLFSSCNEWGSSLAEVRRLLIVVASLATEYGLQGARASVAAA